MPEPPARRSLRAQQRRQLLWLLAFALLLLGLGLGLRDPWPSDEPRFALVAHWMVVHGQWLFPHRGLELYPDKPPLFMWLQALAWLVTRSWRVAFLLPSLASGLLCVALVHDLGRRLWSHRAGLLAALGMLVCVQFSYQFRHAQIDPVVVAWITLANYGLLRHLLLGPAWRWFAVGCFAAGLGVITKGVGFLALLMLLPWGWARWRGWCHTARPRGWWRWLLGGACFLVPIVAWLGPMLWRVHVLGDAAHLAYAHNILLGQTLHRYAAFGGHSHGLLYLPAAALLEWLPLTLALPWALPAWWRRLRRRDARCLLPLTWLVLVLVFFSFSSGKRDVYILPALPMLALALAPLLPGLVRRRGPQRLLLALTSLLAVVVLLVGLAGEFPGVADLKELAARLAPGIWWMLISIGTLGLLIALATRVRRAPLGWVAFLLVLWGLTGVWGYPLMNARRSASGIMSQARAVVGPGVTLGLVAWKEQNLLQARGPVTEFGFLQPWSAQYRKASAWLRADPDQRALFIQQPAMGDCVRRARATKLGRADHRIWWLVRAAAIIPGCLPADPEADRAAGPERAIGSTQ